MRDAQIPSKPSKNTSAKLIFFFNDPVASDSHLACIHCVISPLMVFTDLFVLKITETKLQLQKTGLEARCLSVVCLCLICFFPLPYSFENNIQLQTITDWLGSPALFVSQKTYSHINVNVHCVMRYSEISLKRTSCKADSG